jgi:hypothetical protein
MLFDPNLGFVRNVVLPLANRNGSQLLFYHHWRYVLSQSWGVVLSPYSWNVKENLRNLFLRGTELPFFLLYNCES